MKVVKTAMGTKLVTCIANQINVHTKDSPVMQDYLMCNYCGKLIKKKENVLCDIEPETLEGIHNLAAYRMESVNDTIIDQANAHYCKRDCAVQEGILLS